MRASTTRRIRARVARGGLVLATALSLATGGAHAGAQTEGEAGDLEITSVTVADAKTVRAVVAVPPTFNQIDLHPTSFAVTVRGGVVPAHVTRDVQGVDVVLVIDVSGSMKGEAIAAAQTSATEFVRRVPPGGRVGIVAFGDDADVVAPLSTDRDGAIAAVAALVAKGETSVHDGLRAAAGMFDATDHRRAVVLLSDGRDTASAATAADAAAAIGATAADFYAITLQTSDTDRQSLSGLVSAAGGRVIEASDAASLSSAYDEVAVRISNRYIVDVTSTARGAVPISVSVAQDGRIASAKTTAQLDRVAPAATTVSRTESARSVAVEETWLDRFGLWIGAATVAAALVLLVMSFGGSAPTRRLTSQIDRARQTTSAFSLDATHQRLVGSAENLIDKSQRRAVLDQALEDASVEMRPAEFLVLVVGVGAVLSLVAWLAFGVLVSIIVAVVIGVVARAVLRSRAARRRRKFLGELDSALTTMAGSLRSGQGLPQALDTVAQESDGPVAEEFRRVVLENRLGRDVVDALHGVERRVGGGDFSWVVKAISIQRELGGDLAEVLDNVAATIRDRNRVRAQVRALSAEGRFSAIVLFSLPIVTVLAVSILSPKYLSSMTDGLLGWIVVSVTGVMMLLGGVWVRAIVRIRF